jgi:DNA-directed DNA polymerase III PolC
MIAISPHTHPESQLTGSALTTIIARAKELGRTHFAYTDLGHLSSCLKAYSLAKKAGLKFAPGIEFYFKDLKCGIVAGTPADRCKYFTGTLYCTTQTAYQELVRTVSRTDMPRIKVTDEEQSLWSWNELEHLSKFDTLLVIGGIHCMVGKALLADGPEVAEKVLLKASSLFGNRLSLALICESWSKKYASVVKIQYTDGTHDSLLSSDIVTTDKARKIKASDLVQRTGHNEIISKVAGGTHFDVGKRIDKVTEHKGFLPLPKNVTLEINTFLLNMGLKHGIKVLASDYAFYATKEDHVVQTMVQEGKNKLKSDLHMKTEEEITEYLRYGMTLPDEKIQEIIENTNKWAANFDNLTLKYEWRFADSGGNALQQIMDLIKRRGLMRWEDPIWTARLREEINVIAKNKIKDLSPYFLPKHDVIAHYEENGALTGPGRGSAAGCLIAYLLGITKVNPFTYDLSFNRFYSTDRIEALKLADIDSDLESRDLLVGQDGKSGYLYTRWGNRAAQISTRGKIRLKSAIKDTNRYFHGSVEKEIEQICKALPDAGQGITDEQFLFGFEDEDGNHLDGLVETSEILQKYIADRPKEWSVVEKSLGITRSFSKHACAFIIADKPISDFVPIKEGHITQYEATACEDAGLVKYDFLVINQLKDIRVCLDLINKKNGEKNKVGYFTHKGKLTYIWDLPEDSEVYHSVWNGATEGCFQISTPGMTTFVKSVMPKKMEDLSIILSLQRPGPLDYIIEATGLNMAQEYVRRRDGGSYEDIEILKELIPETYSVLCYQEQITKIAKELAGFSGSAAENLREAIGKKKRAAMLKIKPDFIDGCAKSGRITQEEAQQLWERIVTFGKYAFNKSHGISYSFITYACMFLKHYYSLEFWAAILTNAKQNEITGKLWPHVKHLVAAPDINLSTDQMEIDYANRKIRAKLGLIRGMGEKSIDPIVEGRPYESVKDFVYKGVAAPSLSRKLIHVGVLDSLFPPQSTLLEKLQLFEDAIEGKKFNEKSVKPNKEGSLPTPKKGEIPEEYLNIEKDPMKNAAVRKSILPSLLVGLHDLGRNHSKCIKGSVRSSKIMTAYNGHECLLVTGEMLQRLNEMPADSIPEDKYVAATAYVVSTEILDYKKNTKQALKVTCDFDGFVVELVQWPDYFSGQLIYPKELKKGNIVTVFLKKRAGKTGKNDNCSIQDIVIEA